MPPILVTVNGIGWGKHFVIIMAVLINLWIGGDLIEVWLGHGARAVFELLLILGWLTLIVGMRVPLPWRRPRDDEDRAGGGPSARDRE